MIAWEESPRQFKMSKQLDEGKFGEDLARKFLNDPIIKVNHGISHYDDVTQDKSYQDKDTHCFFWELSVSRVRAASLLTARLCCCTIISSHPSLNISRVFVLTSLATAIYSLVYN